MTLKEIFINLYPHQTEQYLDHEEAEKCEKIADEFAIGFAEWLIENKILSSKMPLRELLDMFKKEKGL
jgi:hypothetical protein